MGTTLSPLKGRCTTRMGQDHMQIDYAKCKKIYRAKIGVPKDFFHLHTEKLTTRFDPIYIYINTHNVYLEDIYIYI